MDSTVRGGGEGGGEMSAKERRVLDKISEAPEKMYTAELLGTSYSLLSRMRQKGWLRESGVGIFWLTAIGLLALAKAGDGEVGDG